MDLVSKLGTINLKLCLGIAGVQLIGYALYKVIKTAFFSKLLKVPGLQYGPLYGNLREAMQGEAMDSSVKWVKKHGSILRFYHFLGEERLLLADAEGIRHVLVTNSQNYPRKATGGVRDLVPQGLFVHEGPQHRSERKLLNPSFNNAAVQGFLPLFEESGCKLVKKLHGMLQSGAHRINIQVLMSAVTLDVIALAGFHKDFGALENPENDLAKCINFLITLQQRSLASGVLPFYKYLPIARNRNRWRATKVVDDFLYKVILEKRQSKESENNLLGKLMAARYEDSSKGLTDSAIRDHFLTFLIAGHETSSMTLTWLLYELSRHADKQDKLYKELDSVSQEDIMSADKLDNLLYLDACVKEILRLYPAASSLIRVSLHDDVIGGYEVPAGTKVVCHFGAMMRTAVEDGEVFRPERFLEEGYGSSQWLPFGIGPHACIGNKFAFSEMKILITNLIKNFKFEPVPDLKIHRKYRLTLRPVPDVELFVTCR